MMFCFCSRGESKFRKWFKYTQPSKNNETSGKIVVDILKKHHDISGFLWCVCVSINCRFKDVTHEICMLIYLVDLYCVAFTRIRLSTSAFIQHHPVCILCWLLYNLHTKAIYFIYFPTFEYVRDMRLFNVGSLCVCIVCLSSVQCYWFSLFFLFFGFFVEGVAFIMNSIGNVSNLM